MNSLKTLLAAVANAFEQSGSIKLEDGSEIVFKYVSNAVVIPQEAPVAIPVEPDKVVEPKKYKTPRVVHNRDELYPKISPVLNEVKIGNPVTIEMKPYLGMFPDLVDKKENDVVHRLASLAVGYFNRTKNINGHLSYRAIPGTTKVTLFLNEQGR